MNLRRLLVLLIGVATWACVDSGPAPPPETQPPPPPAPADQPAEQRAAPTEPVTVEGTFTFANEAGTELLSLAESETPGSYTSAVCGAGVLPVRYVRTQRRSADSNHRQVASNFANEPGDVYQLQGDVVRADATCFVTTDAFAARVVAVERTLGNSPCGTEQLAQLERIANRGAVHCWRSVALENGSEFVVAQFEHVDTLALAAVALVQDSVLLFHGLPGRYTEPGGSVWRVDDGGVFDPAVIHLLLAARLPDGHALAFAWVGAEGESLRLVVADSGVEARNVIDAYRYWAPY